MRIAHFEALSGIAGDMAVAALLDAAGRAGIAIDDLRSALLPLALGGYAIDAERVEVGGTPALHLRVDVNETAQPHRTWSDIRSLLDSAHRAGLAAGAYERATAIFEVLARAEAEVHEVDVEHVHFHEVGAVDSIVDIVAASWLLDRLAVDRCTVSTLPTGSGTVETAHGRLPVPAPATALLLRGFEVRAGDGEGELVTPTGAAILRALAKPLRPSLLLEASGTGAGTRRLRDRPNVLRVFVGLADDESDEDLVLLEADIDDMTPVAVAQACERLRAEGARDVSVTALQMKKGRLAMRLLVLCDYGRVETLATAVLLHTSTLGVRYRAVARALLARRIELVETDYGSLRVKIALRPDGSETAEPEFEDVARASRERGAPLADVRAAALAALGSRTARG